MLRSAFFDAAGDGRQGDESELKRKIHNFGGAVDGSGGPWWAKLVGRPVPCRQETCQAAGGLEKLKCSVSLKLSKAHKLNLLSSGYESLQTHYTVERLLGEGAFGKVYEVKDKRSGGRWACKQLSKVKIFDEGSQQMVIAEIEIMRHLPFCGGDLLQLWDAFEDQQYVYLIIELCEGGDVLESTAQHFKEGEGICYSEEDAAALLRQMIKAVHCCHKNGVVHRDIKPENFLWSGPAKGTGELRLADFGLAALLPDGEKRLAHQCGTPPYMAPEIWKGTPCRTEPDVWALGIILSVLLTGYYPFKFTGLKDCARAICEDELDFNESPWTLISAEAKDLLSQMLEKHPLERITLEEAMQHPWMAGGESSSRQVTCHAGTPMATAEHQENERAATSGCLCEPEGARPVLESLNFRGKSEF